MRILFVTYLFPYPPDGGYKLRVYNTIRELAREHEIDLVCCTAEQVEERSRAQMASLCRAVHILARPPAGRVKRLARYLGNLPTTVPYPLFSRWDREKVAFVRQILERTRYDAAVAEHLIAGRILREALRDPFPQPRLATVMVNHNVESVLFREIAMRRSPALAPLHAMRACAYRSYEARLLSAFDLVVAMSVQDRRQMERLAPSARFIVLPNGVDTGHFAPRGGLPEGCDIYYAGSFGYFPNVDAVGYFMAEIMPRLKSRVPQARFLIVGGDPPAEVLSFDNGGDVRVLGYQEDIRTVPLRCRAAIVPLRLGSGTRLKIVEAMSMGIPVVSTGKGAEGLTVTDGEEILLADEADAFADKVASLLTDDRLAENIGRGGRRLVERRYSWRRIVGEFGKALAEEVRRVR